MIGALEGGNSTENTSPMNINSLVYPGLEFVIILPVLGPEAALECFEVVLPWYPAIRQQVRQEQIGHRQGSQKKYPNYIQNSEIMWNAY